MFRSLLLSLAVLAAPASPVLSCCEALEHSSGGRLGISILDTGSGRRWDFHGDQRFPMCSTFKALLAGEMLVEVDAGRMRLEQQIPYKNEDLLDYAPVVRAHGNSGSLSLEELCRAALQWSDNTAANLLLKTAGGPESFNRFARKLGDPATHLDRLEPDLNEAEPGDLRDTSTPAAMRGSLQELLLGHTLSATSRGLLSTWMSNSPTGMRRLKAGFPVDWDVKDKSGMGQHGTTNDMAMVTPPGRAPLFIVVFLTGATIGRAEQDAILAQAGHIALEALTP